MSKLPLFLLFTGMLACSGGDGPLAPAPRMLPLVDKSIDAQDVPGIVPLVAADGAVLAQVDGVSRLVRLFDQGSTAISRLAEGVRAFETYVAPVTGSCAPAVGVRWYSESAVLVEAKIKTEAGKWSRIYLSAAPVNTPTFVRIDVPSPLCTAKFAQAEITPWVGASFIKKVNVVLLALPGLSHGDFNCVENKQGSQLRQWCNRGIFVENMYSARVGDEEILRAMLLGSATNGAELSVAELLRMQGYVAAAFGIGANESIVPAFLGFDEVYSEADAVNSSLAWLARPAPRPFFLTVVLADIAKAGKNCANDCAAKRAEAVAAVELQVNKFWNYFVKAHLRETTAVVVVGTGEAAAGAEFSALPFLLLPPERSGVPPPLIRSQIKMLPQDLYATILGLAQAPMPTRIPSRSLAWLLDGHEEMDRSLQNVGGVVGKKMAEPARP